MCDFTLMIVCRSNIAQDDPVIEYEDEFGRVRSAKRSEVPRHLLPRQEGVEGDDECVIFCSICRAFLTVVSIIAASLFVCLEMPFRPVQSDHCL